ncbi:MAG: RNA-binding S4 domain-containing protein [Paracoccaceae bacterium]|nr:RNA-binding S4 domain-containing protein [Paracoccaceae bacterium]MDE3237545.1 RNA-binding S4 domain-containing protein [Paracoccaceae bacterium]
MTGAPVGQPPRETIRLDKWLWQARFFKTRGLATKSVQDGGVRLNAARVSKPAQQVGPGDTLTFIQGGRVRVVRILATGARRGPALEAQALYDDLSEPAGEVGIEGRTAPVSGPQALE